MNFSYFLPTKVVFGFGSLGGLGVDIKSMDATKALIVTDRVMVKTGTVQKVVTAIGDLKHEIFDEVEAEPRVEVADAVAEKVRTGKYDLVVGVGGGSSMDMAKVAAAFATNPGPARKYVGNNLFTSSPVKSVMVPTTAGTGAELTVTSMVTVDSHKQWINSPLLLPTLAVVDPELTLTMPQSVTAATGMDALSHNTEAYLSTLASPITDAIALEGIRLVSTNVEKAYENGADRKAREAMSLGALLGGIALQAKMVYGHSIGYTIATRFNLPHGVSCGLPLPYIIASYSVACAPKMKQLAEAFGATEASEDPQALGLGAARRVEAICSKLKIPHTLRDLGVKKEELPALAAECLSMYPRPNSPLVLDEGSMERFYLSMWEGRLQS